MSSITAIPSMKFVFVLLLLVAVISRIRTEEPCGDELTCQQSNQLLLQKQLTLMQEQFHQIQQMHEADRNLMLQQLEFAAKQAGATQTTVSFSHLISSGVITSVLPIILCLLIALSFSCYRKICPTAVQHFRNARIQREADWMMHMHQINEVSKVFAGTSQLPDNASAHELQDIPSGSSPRGVVTV